MSVGRRSYGTTRREGDWSLSSTSTSTVGGYSRVKITTGPGRSVKTSCSFSNGELGVGGKVEGEGKTVKVEADAREN